MEKRVFKFEGTSVELELRKAYPAVLKTAPQYRFDVFNEVCDWCSKPLGYAPKMWCASVKGSERRFHPKCFEEVCNAIER